MLSVESVDAGYGRMTVLRGVSLEVHPGEIVLLLGPNGAGKSTLLRTVSGLITPQRGVLSIDGRAITGASAERISRHGVRHVMEGHRIFPELSVEDNIRIGQINLPRSRRRSDQAIFEESFEVFGVLGEKRRLLARNLSGGQQQMLALVQAWVGQPKYLLCDEPSLGLALSLVPEILEFLRRRAEEGMGVLLVEQLIDQPLRYADRVAVLSRGEIRLQGRLEEIGGRDALAEQLIAAP